MNKQKPSIMNESGNLAVDFLFGITICFICMAIFFAMTFTLSVVEIAQYIGFATARTYNASRANPSDQLQAAQNKFNILLDRPSFKPLFKESGWFDLKINGEGLGVRDFGNTGEYPSASAARDVFVGARLKLTANMLDMDLPLVGGSSQEGPFSTFVTAFLGREPSTAECEEFMNTRFTSMENLGYTMPGDPQDLITIVDNGC